MSGIRAAALLLIAQAAWAQSPALPRDALPVPLVRQATTYSCGAAALAAVLYYFGVFDGREAQLYGPLRTTEKDGTEPGRIARVAERFHLRARYQRCATLDEVRAALRAGTVVILDLQAWRERPRAWAADWDDGHYVVLVGADDAYLYLMDPSTPARYAFLATAELLARWHDLETVAGRQLRVQHMAIFVDGPAPSPRPLAPLD